MTATAEVLSEPTSKAFDVDFVRKIEEALMQSVRLSPRERQVARLVLAGLSNHSVGCELSMEVKTVKHHLSHICRQFEVHSRAALMAKVFGYSQEMAQFANELDPSAYAESRAHTRKSHGK